MYGKKELSINKKRDSRKKKKIKNPRTEGDFI